MSIISKIHEINSTSQVWIKVRNRLGTNFKNTLLSYAATILHMAIAIFTSPIFARNLSAEDFSVVGYYNSLGLFLYPILHLAFNHYYAVTFHRSTDEQRKRTLFTLVSFLTFFNVFFLTACYFIFKLYFKFAAVSFAFTPYIFLMLIQLYFYIWFLFLQIYYRMSRKFWGYFLITSAYHACSIGAALVMVVMYKMGATGRLGGVMVGNAIVSITSLIIMKNKMDFKFDWQILKDGLKFGGPLIVSFLVIIPYKALDSIMLEKLHDVKQFSLYVIGKNHAMYIYNFGTSIYQAFETELFRNIHLKARKQMYINIGIMTILILAPTVIYLILAKPIAAFLTSGRYTDAYHYGRIHAIGYFFLNLSVFITTVVMGKLENKMYLYINLTGAIASVVLFYVMIHYFEFTGAAITRSLVPIIMIGYVVIHYSLKWRRSARNRRMMQI